MAAAHSQPDQEGVSLVTTQPHRVQLHRPHVNPWIVAAVIFAAASFGLGAWMLVDRYTGDVSATEDATSLIDKFNAATTANDGKAAATLLTSNATLSQKGDTLTGANAIAKLIVTHGSQSIERIAPVSVHGEYATTFINFSSLGLPPNPMLSVWQIKHGKIARIWTFYFGLTEPFINIDRS
jgi:hypothetical protein